MASWVLVDVFTNSPAFASGVETLFTGLLSDVLGGQAFTFDLVTPGSDTFDLSVAEAYLQTLDVAKWILDPGEPVNYAGHLVATPLPALLADETGATAQGPKAVYAQIAQGDTVVPNPFNYLLDALTGADVTLYTGASASHAMLLSEGLVQLDAAAFLAHPGSPPLTTRNLP